MPEFGSRLPGCKHQRELRGWSIRELAEHAGLDYKSCMRADGGQPVAQSTARKIAGAFVKHPPAEGMAELLEAAG